MQNLKTGEMVPIDLEEKRKSALRLQEAKDKAISDRSAQGPVFRVGEILEIKGGRFRVQSIRRNGLVLKSLPGLKK